MSDGVNKVILLGNLGGDPELRETKSGISVCNFRVATNTRHGRDDKRRTHTEWHSVVAWGRIAEMCAEDLVSGSKVYIDGHLQTKKWEDKSGSVRFKTEVVVDTVVFLDDHRNSEEKDDVE